MLGVRLVQERAKCVLSLCPGLACRPRTWPALFSRFWNCLGPPPVPATTHPGVPASCVSGVLFLFFCLRPRRYQTVNWDGALHYAQGLLLEVSLFFLFRVLGCLVWSGVGFERILGCSGFLVFFFGVPGTGFLLGWYWNALSDGAGG